MVPTRRLKGLIWLTGINMGQGKWHLWGECLREVANVRKRVSTGKLSVPVQGGPKDKRCKGRGLIVFVLV